MTIVNKSCFDESKPALKQIDDNVTNIALTAISATRIPVRLGMDTYRSALEVMITGGCLLMGATWIVT